MYLPIMTHLELHVIRLEVSLEKDTVLVLTRKVSAQGLFVGCHFTCHRLKIEERGYGKGGL